MRHPLLLNTKPQRAVEAIEELQSSLGWKLVEAMTDDDLLHAAAALGENPNMTESEIHYRRGMIKATQNMKALPEMLRNYFINQHVLEESKAK